MLLLLLIQSLVPSPPAAQADTIQPPHDALHYDITLVPSDTSAHLLGEVETVWRLRSDRPVEVQLDSTMRVVRVLVDSRPQTRLSRTMYGRSAVDLAIPHEKHAGDSITARVRYHGYPRAGLISRPNPAGARTIFTDNQPDRAHFWLPVPADPNDKATVTFHIQAPLGDSVTANGVLTKVDTLPYRHAVWHYRMDTPISTDAIAVRVGRTGGRTGGQ